jgi:hypothetical protein
MAKWSFEDVARLQSLYMSKTSMLEMAKVLDRTPTAINKALARSGVRKPQKHKEENKKRKMIDPDQKWVSLEVVKNFLSKQLVTQDLNPVRLLILANKLRAEKHLPPFYVPGITK